MPTSPKETLRSIFDSLPLPVIRGPLRGYRWVAGSGGKILRILLSTYEQASIAEFRGWIQPGDTVFDVGAHMGYYTLMASELVGPDGTVVAFEPEPRNAAFLEKHVSINRCTNVVCEPRAVADRSGTIGFQREGSGTGYIAGEGDIEVPVTSLNEYVAESGYRPDVMKIDVEGAETQVLSGAAETLRDARPQILLSIHNDEADEQCRAILEDAGYDVQLMSETRATVHSGLRLCMPR